MRLRSRSQAGKDFALGPINLKIDAGETLFIVGENGSGKTTLIKLLLGLYHPDVRRIAFQRQAGRRSRPRRLPPTLLGGVFGLLPV